MFRENTSYTQGNLFGYEYILTDKQKKYLERSTEFTFFKEVFHIIDEKAFSCLYSKEKSRPNVPINQLVGSLILKHLNDWTYSELFKNLNFNFLTRYAIGIIDPRQDVFAEASIFNFQNRLISHYKETGEDLISEVFMLITKEHLKKYNVDATTQRGDSFLVDSKVIDYSRLRLLIEVVKRLFRRMDQTDQYIHSQLLEDYLQITSGQYVFNLRKQDLSEEYEKIASVFYTLKKSLDEKYKESQEYENFERVYFEYMIVNETDTKIRLKDSNAAKSSDLKSPDDPEATFTSKYGQSHIGYSTHISETINPENDIDLITDVIVSPNNVSDDQILETRIDYMKENMPEWNEYFVDGAYGNKNVDMLNEEHEITQYQNGIKGRKSFSEFRIHKKEDGGLVVVCEGNQKIEATKTIKRYKAIFDNNICVNCPLESKCNVKKVGGKFKLLKRTYYFDYGNVLAHQRITNIERLPEKRRKIRSNVEATVKEMKRGMKNGKVRVKRWIRVSMHMIFTALAVNLRRIHLKMA